MAKLGVALFEQLAEQGLADQIIRRFAAPEYQKRTLAELVAPRRDGERTSRVR